MTLKASLDAMADKILTDCEKETTSLPHKIDAFKAVSTYYIATAKEEKTKPKRPPAGTFGDIHRRVNGAHTGDEA